MKIGVFDSGIGGKSVANAIEKAMPDYEVVFRDDRAHMPYGTKSLAEIRGYVTPIVQEMAKDCDVIVVACNTVSTNLIDELRDLVAVPLVAMEPMVKPAIEATTSKVIAVFATPRTLASERYHWLKQEYAKGIQVIEPDCSDWASLIEANQMEQQRIKQDIDDVCAAGADVIVLGCTHYHWIEESIIKEANGRAKVLQPEQSVVQQLKHIIDQL